MSFLEELSALQTSRMEFLKREEIQKEIDTFRPCGALAPFFMMLLLFGQSIIRQQKPTEMIGAPDEIVAYVQQKVLPPGNTTWSLVDNQLIRYQIADTTPSGYKQKNLFTYRN